MMSAKDVLEMAGNAAMGFSALLVAILGVVGLNTWRRRSRSEAARELLGLSRRAVAEIQATRTSVTRAGEAFDRERGPGETDGERLIYDERYARMKRLERPRQTLIELYGQSWQAEALLGIDLGSCLAPIAQQFDEIQRAILTLYMIDSTGHPAKRTRSADGPDEEWMKVYGLGSKEDTVSLALDRAIEELRRRLKRHI